MGRSEILCAMSQENVELARRCTDAFAARDWSLLTELIAPEVVVDMSRNIFNADVYRGYDGIRRWAKSVDDMWEDFRTEPAEFIDAGEHVVGALRILGRGREGGVDTSMLVFSIWSFRDGRVSKLVGGYRDRAKALKAAGLSE
jgi:ketosteroid isomerase-like protein